MSDTVLIFNDYSFMNGIGEYRIEESKNMY